MRYSVLVRIVDRGTHCTEKLKALPYLGFDPDDLTSAPSRVVAYLALQLSVPSEALTEYGDREHTRTDHLREIQDRLGFRDTRPADSAALGSWLLERALEHDKPMVLFHLACKWLLQEHLVRPGVTIVERLVATTREWAQDETYRRLTSLLTPALRHGRQPTLIHIRRCRPSPPCPLRRSPPHA